MATTGAASDVAEERPGTARENMAPLGDSSSTRAGLRDKRDQMTAQKVGRGSQAFKSVYNGSTNSTNADGTRIVNHEAPPRMRSRTRRMAPR
jgi:hypothetical protein